MVIVTCGVILRASEQKKMKWKILIQDELNIDSIFKIYFSLNSFGGPHQIVSQAAVQERGVYRGTLNLLSNTYSCVKGIICWLDSKRKKNPRFEN